MKLVLTILSASRLDFIHSATALSSWFSLSLRSIKFLHAQYILVSSANRWKVSDSEALGESLIDNKNSRGPRTDPWGTPQVIERWLESLLTNTYYWLPLASVNNTLLDLKNSSYPTQPRSFNNCEILPGTIWVNKHHFLLIERTQLEPKDNMFTLCYFAGCLCVPGGGVEPLARVPYNLIH